jgi:hypothetical protein
MMERTAIIAAGWEWTQEAPFASPRAGEVNNARDREATRPKEQEVTRSVSRLLTRMIRDYRFEGPGLHASDLIVGSHYGRMEFIVKGGEQASQLGYTDYCGPNYFTHSISSAITGQASIDHRISGETVSLNTGDLSGLDAIGYCHLVADIKPGFLFAGGADSAFAIQAVGDKMDDLSIGGGAGLFALCNEGYAALNNRLPLAYILDYVSCLCPGHDHSATEDLLLDALASPAFADKKKILLIPLGDYPVMKLGRALARDKRIHPVPVMRQGGAATGPVALANVLHAAGTPGSGLFGFPGISGSTEGYDGIFLAGYESNGKYAHLAVGL